MLGKFFSIIFISLLLISMFTGQKQSNKSPEEFTKSLNNIKWTSSLNEVPDENINGLVINSIYKFTDFLGYFYLGAVKQSIKFGYEHPNYDYKTILDLIKFYLIALIIISFIPLILPLIALIIIAIDSYKEWRKKRKCQRIKKETN